MQDKRSPYYLSMTRQSPGQPDEVCRTPNFLEPHPAVYQLITDVAFSTTIHFDSDRFSVYKDNMIFLIRSPVKVDEDGGQTIAAFDLEHGQMQGCVYVIQTGPNYEGSYFNIAFTTVALSLPGSYYICCPCLSIIRTAHCS